MRDIFSDSSHVKRYTVVALSTSVPTPRILKYYRLILRGGESCVHPAKRARRTVCLKFGTAAPPWNLVGSNEKCSLDTIATAETSRARPPLPPRSIGRFASNGRTNERQGEGETAVIKLNGTRKTGERERTARRCKTVSFPPVESIGQSGLKSRSIFSGRATATSPRRINSTSGGDRRRGGEARGERHPGAARVQRIGLSSFRRRLNRGKRVHLSIPETRMRLLSSGRANRADIRVTNAALFASLNPSDRTRAINSAIRPDVSPAVRRGFTRF